ncbi:FtsB family cell division protein [Oceanomicrobium pacificus]|uniref:Septum formation initiator family protein n=1 Tax=Oceanomicrobium pacificus TaxID=2692916 RepID=A0A6B0TZ91_9RHOB|nr:septum formation initiator family protein [Oceanomicrobium pacificus]MXU66333.1 septum formation initiator family protein [Oceanomicrobium pacificus]
MDSTTRRTGLTDLLVYTGSLLLIVYFTYAALQGEYGLFRLFMVEAKEQALIDELESLQADRAVIANKTKRLSNSYLDLDLLDEQARRILGMARGDEIVIR